MYSPEGHSRKENRDDGGTRAERLLNTAKDKSGPQGNVYHLYIEAKVNSVFCAPEVAEGLKNTLFSGGFSK